LIEKEEKMKTTGDKMCVGLFCLFVSLCLMGSFATVIHGADSSYPDRAITVVVPYAAGGVTDLAARAISEALEKALKQPVVVVNKPGGRATVGGYAVVTAKPDGYTLGFLPIASCLPEVFSYFFQAPYSSGDLKPISGVASAAMTFAVKADAPWNSFKEVVEFARKNPGVKVGMPGRQTGPYMVMVQVNKKEKVNFVDVPFAGGDAETTPALLGGHVTVGAIDYSAIKSLVDAKKLKPLAVCTDKRVDFAPNVPTVVELGYELPYVSILGFFGPKEMPDEFVKKIDEAVSKASREQSFRTRLRDTICIQPTYEDAATYRKSLVRYKASMSSFFKEEGLVKK
jgi:tripartite-type tricarboxylate transporter receptor subunit TctC